MKQIKLIKGCITADLITEGEPSTSKNCGAEACFKGVVRSDIHDNKKVISLSFSCSKEIAIPELNLIADEAIKRFDINELTIFHSIGKVNAGKTCFYVGVKSKHRTESFAALPWIVNSVKDRVPLFGKEILEDGGYVWKQNK